MSDALYAIRLYWDGRRGVARFDGVRIELLAVPGLLGEHVTEIDYAPEASVFQLREDCDRARHMTSQEIALVNAWLVQVAFAARTAMSS